MKDKIQIIIPSCGVNFETALKSCIESLTVNTDLRSGDVEILLVMNGMKDKEKFDEFIHPLQDSGLHISHVWYDNPEGYVNAINIGIKHTMTPDAGIKLPDYILFLNDDVVIHSRQWLELLSGPFKSDPLMGLVGAKSLPCPITGVDFPLGFCVLIKKEVFEKIGVLDEIWEKGFNDDVDFCIRAMKTGYHVYSYVNGYDKIEKKSIGTFPVSHTAENTMHSGELFSIDDWNKQTAKNRILLADKYWQKVHVILPVYKRYHKLKIALNSIKNQYYWKTIVHVVSDGKDEKVREIVEQIKTEWAKEKYSPEIEYTFTEFEGAYGGGPRKTVLDSLESREDEWCVFVDSDNEISPDYILKLWQATFLKPEVGISICQIKHTEENRVMPLEHKIEWGKIDSLNFMVRLDIAKKHAEEWIHKKNRKSF